MKKYIVWICGVSFPVLCCIGLELLAGVGGTGILASLTDNRIILVIGISAIILVIGMFAFKKKGGMRCDISKK